MLVSTWFAWLAAEVLYLAGPIVPRLAPYLVRLPSLSTIKLGLRVASYIAVLALGAWSSAKAINWWYGDRITIAEADGRGKAKCDVTIAEATAAARLAALEERERALDARTTEVEADERALAEYRKSLEVARESLSNDNAAFVRGDDRWLLEWQRAGR